MVRIHHFRPVTKVCALMLFVVLLGSVFFWRSRVGEQCAYDLINPTRCNEKDSFQNPEYDAIRSEIAGYVAQQKVQGVAQTSVFFRDLRNGPTFSIAANDDYIGASLLKLPILLRYMKESEMHPGLLSEKVVAQIEPSTTNQGLPAAQTLEQGKAYTIQELLERMVMYSDNNSRAALVKYYQGIYPDRNIILDTLEDIGIANVLTDENGTHLSVQDTASVFRILYNASYLSSEDSQKTLALLTRSAYDDGIAKPIPPGIRVANKYGIFNKDGAKELHDCGIVFYPKHPYVLCIMSRGQKISTLQETISHISETVYGEVARRFPQS